MLKVICQIVDNQLNSVLFLTWLEEHNGLQAGELGRINSEGLEAAEDLLQEAQVQASVAGFSLHARAEVWQRQQWAAVQWQRPLDGAEEEEFTPCFLQQDDLVKKKNQKLNMHPCTQLHLRPKEITKKNYRCSFLTFPFIAEPITL